MSIFVTGDIHPYGDGKRDSRHRLTCTDIVALE